MYLQCAYLVVYLQLYRGSKEGGHFIEILCPQVRQYLATSITATTTSRQQEGRLDTRQFEEDCLALNLIISLSSCHPLPLIKKVSHHWDPTDHPAH